MNDWRDAFIENRIASARPILAGLGLAAGSAVAMTCPSCGKSFWLRVPPDLEATLDLEILIACPYACGAGFDIRQFNPSEAHPGEDNRYDTRVSCVRHRHGFDFAADGVVLRCPVCHIETPREVAAGVVADIEAHIAAAGPFGPDRHTLEALLGRIVSTFDGVMRWMLDVAGRNHQIIGLPPLPTVNSFQNLSSANRKLASTGWSMSQAPKDWDILVRAFQKRHLITHTLGVVEQEYVEKTGDTTVAVGRVITLTSAEVLEAAKVAHRIVKSFFGQFLS